MKKMIIIFISLLTFNLLAQNITKVEYFIDFDPGFGNGTQIVVTPAPDITLNFTIDLGLIADGFHVLYLRGKDSNGNWSITYSKPFYKHSIPNVLPDITKMEYFIDIDPGFGNGNNITITPGQDITANFIVELSSFDDGFHVLYVRGKDANSNWSLALSRPFYKETQEPLANITEVKYYFSNADTITPVYSFSNFTQAPDVDVSFEADISTLARNTNYYFHIYGRDYNSKRSIEYTHEFTVESTNNPPTVSIHLLDITLNEDFGTIAVSDLDTIFTDPDIPFGDSLRYTITISNGIMNDSLTASILHLTSVSDSNGVAQVIVRAIDDSLASVRDTFQVTINPLNDPPVFSNLPDSLEFAADTSIVINIWDFVEDIESPDSLLVFQFDASSDSLLRNYNTTNGELTLSSQQMHFGTDSLFITVTDDSGAATTDTMLVFILQPTGISDDWFNQIPKKFVLLQNYPNPFNPETIIEFSLEKPGFATLTIFNTLGQEIATVIKEQLTAGDYVFNWNAANFASGVYYYRLIISDSKNGSRNQFTKTRKLIFMK